MFSINYGLESLVNVDILSNYNINKSKNKYYKKIVKKPINSFFKYMELKNSIFFKFYKKLKIFNKINYLNLILSNNLTYHYSILKNNNNYRLKYTNKKYSRYLEFYKSPKINPFKIKKYNYNVETKDSKLKQKNT
jgi:hypothetical protein